jgi:predicted enzyme related to lactoylglutathione lyase
MSERIAYGPGEFCWVELASPDVDAAATFYGDLLDWERERYEPDPEGYWYFRRDGKLVAGLEALRTAGQVPAWLSYVRVDDVTGTVGKVGGAGGTVLTRPLDVPGEAGSMAVCQDTEGAAFALWQPGELNWQVDGQRWPEELPGLMRMGTDMPPDAPPHWQEYLVVESTDEAVEKNQAAGGRLIYGPVDIPIARMAVVLDPQGANVALLESRYPEPR